MWRPTEAGAAPGFAGRASSAEIGRWSCWDRRRLAPARWVPARSRAGGGGYCVPLGWAGPFPKPRGAAPRCPACPAGVPISPEKWEKEGRGFAPGPHFLWPLVATRWFLGLLFLIRLRGYFSGILRPIWGAFSGKIC